MLLNHRDIAVQYADVVAAALTQYRKASSVSFSDSLILEIAREAGQADRRAAAVMGSLRLR